MLDEMGVDVPTRSLPGRPHENWALGMGGATDAEVISSIRKEQGALRSFLLAGRQIDTCSICGLALPADMLVAGHIVPRAELSDEQRHNFRSVAMLVCLLGCDALFESGRIVVADHGDVRRGAAVSDPVLQAEIDRRVGRQSAAWTVHTAPQFRNHAWQSNKAIHRRSSRTTPRRGKTACPMRSPRRRAAWADSRSRSPAR